jgi:hypothetical protein
MREDGVGVQLRHARRAHHDRGGAERLRLARIGYAGARAVGRRARHDRHASVGLFHDELEHGRAFVLLEPRDFAGHAERRQAVRALVNEEVDHLTLAAGIEIPGVRKCRGDNGIDALEWHR